MKFDLLVIGAGPAGMAAAIAAREAGISRILLVERSARPGGVLPQCIHDGFGLFEFGISMTGPEYTDRWSKMLEKKIELWLDTMVLAIEKGSPFRVRLINPKHGMVEINVKSIIIATGCRERTLGQLRIPGARPSGIYTAGAAQYMMNLQNFLPGKSAVILGSGDIGLIMARRLTLEGVRVKLILGEKASGLVRNYIQCVRDFGLPIRFGYTVLSIHGYRRLKGITIAPVDELGQPDQKQKKYIPCDTLLVAAGLIPETELWKGLGQTLSGFNGIPVENEVSTPQPGIFACGNVVRVYDTADEVSDCGRLAGRTAAGWLKKEAGKMIPEKKNYTLGIRLEEQMIEEYFELLLCTGCPNGCALRISKTEESIRVSGSQCAQGERFAMNEMTAPERILTTTVRVKNGKGPLVPVKTDRGIPKKLLSQAMKECRRVYIEAPVKQGSVIIQNIADSGADLIATGQMAVRENETDEKKTDCAFVHAPADLHGGQSVFRTVRHDNS